jgi:hypothetical protein
VSAGILPASERGFQPRGPLARKIICSFSPFGGHLFMALAYKSGNAGVYPGKGMLLAGHVRIGWKLEINCHFSARADTL